MSWPFFLRKFSWRRPNGRLRIAAHLHIFRARGCPRVQGVRCGSRAPGKCTSAPLCEASDRAVAGGGKASASGGGRRGCAALTRLGWARERPVRARERPVRARERQVRVVGAAKGAALLRLGALLRGWLGWKSGVVAGGRRLGLVVTCLPWLVLLPEAAENLKVRRVLLYHMNTSWE